MLEQPLLVLFCRFRFQYKLFSKMGNFGLESRKMDFVEVFLLISVNIFDMKFGEKISSFWTSLRRLNLDKVKCIHDIYIKTSSLEELELSNCEIGRLYSDWILSIASSSLKSVSVSRCHFKSSCRSFLDCPSLMNFSVIGSVFDMPSTFKMASQSLDNLGICSSNFKKSCSLYISCPAIKQIKINGCRFKELCSLKMNSISLDVLNVSDCEFIYADEKISESGCQKRINVFAQRLQTLTINSSDKYSYKFPLCISAPSLQAIIWKGNPVDFSYLKSFMSLEYARIDIQPSCQHKSKKLASRCKLFMGSIYSVAVLLQSLKDVKSLEINVWPIELFFMQNDEPIIFKNLLHLFLLVNDLSAEQLSGIASFLKGLPNLITLVVKCEKKSALRGDPELIVLLGLCPKAFTVSFSEDSKQLKIARGNAQGVDVDDNFIKCTSVGMETAT
ncbi:uncharacterized protein [Euphorbia lathyris]|uniref:uncharacterized protein isoform X2 n=1 Tax=Euphorbia lathyris TaxID=212925 RepID=UPI003313DF04